jgi:NAD(P)-dependent dehydrogenase (short-subunit alcohol dehydrogenase family)
VTGASSGIGAALCRALRVRGWHVVGLSRGPAEDADDYEACDVGDRDAVRSVAASVLERHPLIDLLVNNAGVGARGGFLGVDDERLERALRTNYLGSVWCTRAFAPAMPRGSRLVNVVSVAGIVAAGPYSASKHAQVAFSRSVAVELAPRGVRVLTVLPGYVETPGFPQRERFGPLLGRLVVDAPYVAERILHALDRDRREIYVPEWYRPAAWVAGLAPGTVTRLRMRFGDPPTLRRSVDSRRT